MADGISSFSLYLRTEDLNMLNLPIIPRGSTVEKYGNGLINNTYKVTSANPDEPDYLLQKINHKIFKDIEGLQNNIKKVTDHIRKKLEDAGVQDVNRRVLTPVEFHNPAVGSGSSSRLYFKDESGDYWRLFLFIDGAQSYERMETPEMARIAGKAFGNFHRQLSDFPGETLCDVLPGFHNTPVRIANLRKRVAKDAFDRLKNVKDEVEYLLGRAGEFSKIVEMGKMGLIPKRVVHQDTKFNNILMESNPETDEPEVLCIIDLDTVMTGYICYDVGDAIRSGANRGKEDEKNLDNVGLDFEIYRGFLEGFTEETKDFLTKAELDTLPFGPKLLTYEQAVRFLDDYLDGDRYYKTNYPTHNLVRARVQIKLLQSMDELIMPK